ncbi:dopamine receptor 1 [Schistocerca americana]|uniref:dopamine receptor 1 n=1 Tax=Schistocerca americana TaxID=7009 RepID=UPI001F503800|nr:dopamine receptor 1 [Schistocerca americana]XP_049957205.1 dopamine receptor 1 [Schistocerca serialis cubense]
MANATEEAGADSEDDALETLSVLLVGVFLSLVIFMSIAGNVLVCVAIYTDRGLRRIGNLFLASLAIADLFVAALVMTFAVVNDLLGYWMFGAQFCDTWIAFDVMCSTASILNLCAISLDRYIHIKDPLRYGRWVTRRVAVASIAAIWLLAALISFLPISLGLHRPPQPLTYHDGATEHPTCALDLTPTYAVVSSCISFYFPTLVMLGIYCRLYLYAQKHVKNIRAVTRPLPAAAASTNFGATADSADAGAGGKQQPPIAAMSSSPYHVSDHKAAITVGVIMGVFLICWVPFFCVNIVAAFCKTCIPGFVFKVLTWLGYSNSAFNPVIYSIFNTEFREAFRRILTAHYRTPCCCCCCADGRCGYESVSSRPSLAGAGGRRDAVPGRRPKGAGGVGGGAGGRNGSCGHLRECSSPRSSAGSAGVPTPRQLRVNSTDIILDGEEVSAI